MKTRHSKQSAPPRKQVLLVDDHPLTRDGVAKLLIHSGGLAVTWQASSASEALELVAQHEPDLAMVDISLPDGNGLELIKDLKRRRPGMPVLVFSMHDESLYAEVTLKAGAQGFVSKQEGGARLLQAVANVLAGDMFVSDAIRRRVLEDFCGQSRTTSPHPTLSGREAEVFWLIGQGLSTKQIAEQLKISPKTVEVHRLHIKAKLKVESAPELIALAARGVRGI